LLHVFDLPTRTTLANRLEGLFMTKKHSGKRVAALVALWALAPLCHAAVSAQPASSTPAVSAPKAAVASAANDGFDKVVADGTSLLVPVKDFKALSSDKTYHDSMARWAREMGWNLSWELDSDYSFNFEADFGNDFFKAVDTLCANLNAAGIHARSIVYQGNKVVRIVSEGAKR
jgi:hypothetical protein